jgi:hypothetical protein
MKYLLLALLLLPAAFAITYTDTLNADFNLGNTSEVNVSNDELALNLSGGTYVAAGTYTSKVMDLGSNPTATISWTFTTPTNTSVLVSTRSGASNSSFASWSSWSSDYATSTGSTVTSPRNRYYQYRVQLTTANNTSTPILHSVVLNSTEAGTSITAATAYNTDLTEATATTYNFHVNVSDTYTIVNVTGRYRVNSGVYSSSIDLGVVATNIYNYTVPITNWTSYASASANGTLDLEVTANVTNGTANTTTTVTVQEIIEFVNNAPTLDPLTNYTVVQNASLNYTVTGSDVDGQTITFTTNKSAITVTALTASSARITWTPNATDVGYHLIRVTASDGTATATRTFYINVTDTNDAPTIGTVSAITGYHGVRQNFSVTAIDYDGNDTITFYMEPDLFRIYTTQSSTSNTTYYGIANFTPADPDHGENNVTFFVTDGTETANTTATVSIDYCGDSVCQTTYETESTCRQDCYTETVLDTIALIVPDRNCANEVMEIYTFNATNRFSCYYQGLVEQGFALCEALGSTSVTVYQRNGTLLVSKGTLTSATNGSTTYTPTTPGEYKFSATKEGFANTSQIVYVRDCNADIVITEQNYTINQTTLPPLEERPREQSPSEEEPASVEESSLVSILLFYFIIPLLLAVLSYGSIIFYDVNKDTLPWILEIRIMLYEQNLKFKPYTDKIKKKISPIVNPVMQSLSVLYAATFKPIIDKLKNFRK